MSAHSVRIRVAVVVVMLCVAMLLTGCDWLTGFESFLNNGDIPVSNSKPAKPTEDPGPLYDTDEAPVVESAASEAPIFDNQNILAVQNGGTSPIFKVATASVITKIQTYHWNDAAGNGSTGKISLKAADGKTYGPWDTVGLEGQGGVPNAYWAATPNVTVPAGSYTVIDSDPSTWSQNADSGGVGFAVVYAESAK